jgi:hypothetical protein
VGDRQSYLTVFVAELRHLIPRRIQWRLIDISVPLRSLENSLYHSLSSVLSAAAFKFKPFCIQLCCCNCIRTFSSILILFSLHPGDLYPFTRRPLFLIVDSDNSGAFASMPRNFDQPVVVLMSPQETPAAFQGKQTLGI